MDAVFIPQWRSADTPPDSERNIFICYGNPAFRSVCVGHYDHEMERFYEDRNFFAKPIYDAMYWCDMPRLPNGVENAPTIETVPVVRCKDCKHRILNENYDNKKPGSLKAVCELDTGDLDELGRYAENDDWYCADGERKEGTDND